MKNLKVKPICYMVLSNLLYALSFTLFYLDNEIAAGGFGGVASALCHIVPLTPGLLNFLMTLPFLIWGIFQRGWLFSLETFISSLMFSLFEDALLWTPTLTHNQLLAAIFGGALYSVGTVFMLKAGISAGGTDLVGQLIRHHFPHISHGTLILIFNMICVSIAIFTFGNLETAFYSIIAIYVGSTLTDHFTSGQEKVYISYVITKSAPDPIAAAIETHLRRGVTLQQGVGMYLKEAQNILMIVVKPSEMYRLRDIVTSMDSTAFVVFSLGSSAFGGGFQGPKGRYPTEPMPEKFPMTKEANHV